MLSVKVDQRGRREGFGPCRKGDVGQSRRGLVRGGGRGQDLDGDRVCELAHRRAAARVEEVEVEGGRVHVAVTEKFGEGREVRSGQKLQGREGVPEGVGGHLLRELGHSTQAFDAPLDRPDRDPGAARRDEESGLRRSRVLRPLFDPRGDEGEGTVVEVEFAQCPALSFDPKHRRGYEVQLVEVERDEFVNPEPRLGEKSQDRKVAGTVADLGLSGHRAKAVLELLGREHRGETSRLAHERDLLGGIDLPAQLALRERGEDTQCRELLVARCRCAGRSITSRSAKKRFDLGLDGSVGIVAISLVEREERRDGGGVQVDRAGALGLGREVSLEGSERVAHMTPG